MTISKLKMAATIAMGVALAGSLPFVTRAQNHKVARAPQAALPNPHPVPSDTTTELGSLTLPAVPGWTKEYGNFLPALDVVYYKLPGLLLKQPSQQRSFVSLCLKGSVSPVRADEIRH